MTRDVRELTTLTPLDICRQLSSSPRPLLSVFFKNSTGLSGNLTEH